MRRLGTGAAVAGVVLAGMVWAQAPGGPKVTPGPIVASRVGNTAKPYLAAMGERATKPGQERWMASGTLRLADGTEETVQWAWEFPGKLHLDRPAKRDAIVFDPANAGPLSLGETEDGLLESLSGDTADMFFDLIQSGTPPRLLGHRFQTAQTAGFAREVDIFEMAAPVAARSQKGASVKHFQFDSATGLLARVVYQRSAGGRPETVRTEFAEYETLGGQRAPRRVTRYHGSQKVFDLTVRSGEWRAGAKDGLFSTAK